MLVAHQAGLLTSQRFASPPWNSSFTLAFPQRNTLAELVGWRSEADAVGTDPVSGTSTASAATGAAIRAIREKGMRTTVVRSSTGGFPGRDVDESRLLASCSGSRLVRPRGGGCQTPDPFSRPAGR